ncbi:MAG: DUF885 family protein [Pseudomonadota bacterium]
MQLLQMFHELIRFSRLKRAPARLRSLVIITVSIAALSSVPACSQSNDESRSTRRAISQSQAIASDFLRTELALSPESASRLDLERYLGPTASYALDNHSQAGFERGRLVRIELLQRLQSRPRLPEDHALTRDLQVAERALVDLISLEQLGYGRFDYASMRPYAVDPYSGIWIEGPTLLAYRQSITNADQATAYVSRLRTLSAAVQDTKRRVLADQASGILLPRPLVDETRRRLTQLIDEDNRAMIQLVETFDALLASVPGLSAARREQLSNVVRIEVTDNLIPAYDDLLATLDEAAETAADQAGIWAQPRGLDVYTGILTASIGESFSTERLHENHLQQVATRRANLSAMMTLDPEAFPAQAPKPDRLSRQIAWYTAAMTDPAAPLASVTDPAPQPNVLTELAPKSDWTRIANATDFDAQTDAIRQFQAVMDQPPYAIWQSEGDSARAPYRVIVEYPAVQAAWQHYVWHRAMAETSIETNSVPEVARNSIDLFQAVLAAADTGIHLSRWSIADASDHIAVNSGLGEPVSRQLALSIAARPGYHSAVAIARLRIEALSERAQAVLGEQYSETDFQRTIIEPGPRPLSLIEKDVEAWYGQRLADGSTN